MTQWELLKKIIKAQLRVGATAFGGPLASMSMMKAELVDRESLISSSRYLEGLAIVKMLPGPVATLLAVFLGSEIAGLAGGILSALCFIFPAFVMLLGICFFENQLGSHFLNNLRFLSALTFVQWAVMAIVFQACYKLFKESFLRRYLGQERKLWVVFFFLVGSTLALVGWAEFLILALCAVGGLSWYFVKNQEKVLRVDAFTLFIVFFKAGLTVFGTGYMIFPVLNRILVEENQWITQTQFLNSIAFGNLTPGPIVIASTYMGYHAGSLSGALAATAGIFGGPILLMLFLGPMFRKLLGKPWIEGVMLGLLPAVSATIAVGAYHLGKGFFEGSRFVEALIVTALCFFLVEWKKISALWILLGAGVMGALIY